MITCKDLDYHKEYFSNFIFKQLKYLQKEMLFIGIQQDDQHGWIRSYFTHNLEDVVKTKRASRLLFKRSIVLSGSYQSTLMSDYPELKQPLKRYNANKSLTSNEIMYLYYKDFMNIDLSLINNKIRSTKIYGI